MSKMIKEAPEKGKIEHNQRGSLRIIDHIDKSQLREHTYQRDIQRKYKNRINRCMSGMDNLNDMVHLQLVGKSKLSKEL